jgi:hypothetical protein
MPVTERQREELFAARNAWDEAQERYGEEARKYVVAWFEGNANVRVPEDAVDHGALETLTRLNAEVLAAQNKYAEVAERIRDAHAAR